MTRVLIVDDQEKIRNLIRVYLEREGFEVHHSEDGHQALDVMSGVQVDLLIVDIMMPKMNGYELVQSLRESKYDLPILMITAKNEFKDKRKGFELGVDDYLVKPFDMEELILRVHALLRRSKISSQNRIELKHTVLDSQNLVVLVNDKKITLPNKEFKLLFHLLSYPDKIFTRQDLMNEIWGYDSDADIRTVDVHIKRLREKFSTQKDFEIMTVRGLGYKGVICS